MEEEYELLPGEMEQQPPKARYAVHNVLICKLKMPGEGLTTCKWRVGDTCQIFQTFELFLGGHLDLWAKAEVFFKLIHFFW